MKRIIITLIFTWLALSVWQTLSQVFFSWLALALFPPILCVFSLKYFKPLENIILALGVGFIVDALGGYLLGVNMVFLLLLTFILGATSFLSGKIYRLELSLHVLIVSFIYRIGIFIFQNLILNQGEKFSLASIFFGPMIDFGISLLLFDILVRLLVLFDNFDQSEFSLPAIGNK